MSLISSLRREDGNRYRDREEGRRCEGLYVKEVSGYVATLTSFTRQYDFGDEEGGDLRLSWSTDDIDAVPALAGLENPPLNLRAEATSTASTTGWTPRSRSGAARFLGKPKCCGRCR